MGLGLVFQGALGASVGGPLSWEGVLLGQPANPGLLIVSLIIWNGIKSPPKFLDQLLPILQMETEAQSQGATCQD